MSKKNSNIILLNKVMNNSYTSAVVKVTACNK